MKKILSFATLVKRGCPYQYTNKTNNRLGYNDIHSDLVQRCKEGNRPAQFELYRLYSKSMYNICLRMMKHEGDAEDVLQNSFMDIFSKLDSFAFQSTIGAWIKRIVINNCINYLQRKKVYFEELDSNFLNQVEKTDENEQEQIELTVKSIQQGMMQLPDGYRVVFSLYAMEGYDHEEIAEILNISESTSKSQYSRAKQKLKEILKNER